jgi:uncharacterized protein (DUF2164 family)
VGQNSENRANRILCLSLKVKHGVRMKNRERIVLSKEKKDEMILNIKKFFLSERDEDLGDLAATLILKFITEELAPEFYNQGVYDAYKYINEKSEDLLSLLI